MEYETSEAVLYCESICLFPIIFLKNWLVSARSAKVHFPVSGFWIFLTGYWELNLDYATKEHVLSLSQG